MTIKVTNEDDSTPTFLQYLYEVLVDVDTPKVRASKFPLTVEPRFNEPLYNQ